MAKGERVRGWRKISAATWGPPADPQIYGDLEVDAGPLLAHADRLAAETGQRPTMTHLVAKAVAHALAVNPDLNVRLHRGRVIRRQSVDVFIIASTGGGDDLSGVLVRGADGKDVAAIAAEVRDRAARLQAGEDDLGAAKHLLERLPRPVLRALLRAMAWLTIDLDHDLPVAGVQRQTSATGRSWPGRC